MTEIEKLNKDIEELEKELEEMAERILSALEPYEGKRIDNVESIL